MDEKPYKLISDLYRFIKEKNGHLDEVDVTYVTAILKALTDLYDEPGPLPEAPPKRFSMSDLFKGDR